MINRRKIISILAFLILNLVAILVLSLKGYLGLLFTVGFILALLGTFFISGISEMFGIQTMYNPWITHDAFLEKRGEIRKDQISSGVLLLVVGVVLIGAALVVGYVLGVHL